MKALRITSNIICIATSPYWVLPSISYSAIRKDGFFSEMATENFWSALK